MSNLTVIGGILALATFAYLAELTADRWIRTQSETIIFGRAAGVPVSMEYRRLVLTQSFIPHLFGAFVLNLIATLAFIGIARGASDTFAESLAYICAIAFGFAGLGNVGLGGLWIFYLLSVLRRAELQQA